MAGGMVGFGCQLLLESRNAHGESRVLLPQRIVHPRELIALLRQHLGGLLVGHGDVGAR